MNSLPNHIFISLSTIFVILLLLQGMWVPNAPNSEWRLAFPDFDSKTVNHIEVETVDGIIIIEKKDDGWNIVTPTTVFADQRRIEQILTIIEQVDCTQGLSEEKSQYGLSQPKIHIRTKGKRKHNLIIGDHTPTNTGDYIICHGQPGRSKTKISDRISPELTEYQSKRILNINFIDVQSITFPSGENISKTGGYWFQSFPSKAELDQEAIRSWIQKMVLIKILDTGQQRAPQTKNLKIQTQHEELMLSWNEDGGISSPLHPLATVSKNDTKHLDIHPTWLYAKSFIPPSKSGVMIRGIRFKDHKGNWQAIEKENNGEHPIFQKIQQTSVVRTYKNLGFPTKEFIIDFSDESSLQYGLIKTEEAIYCMSPIEDVLIRVPLDFFGDLIFGTGTNH